MQIQLNESAFCLGWRSTLGGPRNIVLYGESRRRTWYWQGVDIGDWITMQQFKLWAKWLLKLFIFSDIILLLCRSSISWTVVEISILRFSHNKVSDGLTMKSPKTHFVVHSWLLFTGENSVAIKFTNSRTTSKLVFNLSHLLLPLPSRMGEGCVVGLC